METLQDLFAKYSTDMTLVQNAEPVVSKNRLSSFVSDYSVDTVAIVVHPGYFGTRHGYFISGEHFSDEAQMWIYSPLYFRPKTSEQVYPEVLEFTKYFIEYCRMAQRPLSQLN